MDRLDEKIVERLKKDGRSPYTDIAEDLDVTEGTVRNRVNSMKENGVISKFTVETSLPESKGIVLANVSTDKDIDQVVKEIPEDMEINEVAGDHDLIMILRRDSMESLNDVLDSIREIEGITDTKTYTVLKSSSK